MVINNFTPTSHLSLIPPSLSFPPLLSRFPSLWRLDNLCICEPELRSWGSEGGEEQKPWSEGEARCFVYPGAAGGGMKVPEEEKKKIVEAEMTPDLGNRLMLLWRRWKDQGGKTA